MESNLNHNTKYQYVMKLFTEGKKYTEKGMSTQLMNNYLERLDNKEGFRDIYD